MTTASQMQSFKDALAANWQEAFEGDEWFFANLITNATSQLSPSEAFTAIDELVILLLQQTNPTLIYYCGSFLMALARRANTTELPDRLRDQWCSLEDRMSEHADVLDQLRSWYRLS